MVLRKLEYFIKEFGHKQERKGCVFIDVSRRQEVNCLHCFLVNLTQDIRICQEKLTPLAVYRQGLWVILLINDWFGRARYNVGVGQEVLGYMRKEAKQTTMSN